MAAPYTVNIDPQLAQDLVTHGAALLVLDMPPGTLFGVNQHTFAIGQQFKGVKMLPPGTHLFSYRAVSRDAGAAPVTAFFLPLRAQQIVVRRWDPTTETLEPLADAEEEQRYAAGVRRHDFDTGMAPYNLGAHAAWLRVSDMITADLVTRLSPPGGEMSIIAEGAESDIEHPRTQAEKRLMDQLVHGREAIAKRLQRPQSQPPITTSSGPADSAMVTDQEMVDAVQQLPSIPAPPAAPASPDQQLQGPGEVAMAMDSQPPVHMTQQQHGAVQMSNPDATPQLVLSGRLGRCRYTPLPRLIKTPGATPAQLTAMNMDKSALLEQVLLQHYQGHMEALLGELQFAFLAFVYGQTLGGYAQWKALLLLLLGCEQAVVRTHTPHFTKFLRLVKDQLEMSMGSSDLSTEAVTPFGDSMVEELLHDSFLRHMLGQFFNMLQENDAVVSQEVSSAAVDLKCLLRARLGWEYDMKVLGVGAEGDGEDEDAPVVVEDPEDWVRL